MRVSLPVFTSAQCTIDDSHLASQESKRKEFPRSSACSIVSCSLVCSGLHVRYTDDSMCSSRFPFRCGWCGASGGAGCEFVTGQSWNNGCYGLIQMVVVVVALDTEPKGT